MRIAYVTETQPLELNGVSLTATRTVAFLQVRGHDVMVVRPRQRAIDTGKAVLADDTLRVPGVPIPLYPDLRVGLPTRRRLSRAQAAYRLDPVYTATEGPLGWSATRTAQQLGLPATSDFRMHFDEYGRHYVQEGAVALVRAYPRVFYNRTDRTFVPTCELQRQLSELDFACLIVSTHGVDAHQFMPRARSDALCVQRGANTDTPVVPTVGRLALEKNLGVALDAFHAVCKRVPRTRPIMVGDSPQRNALRRHCPDTIFGGMQHSETLAVHYASADVFLFPNLIETFSNMVVEAMASGLPVVAFDTAVADMLVRSQENGWLAPIGDTVSFAQAAVTLAIDAGLRQRFGRQRG